MSLLRRLLGAIALILAGALPVSAQSVADFYRGKTINVLIGVGVVFAVAVTQLAMLVTTVYLHRHLAHGSVALRPEVRAVSRIVLWITTALKPRQWAGVHRHHHAARSSESSFYNVCST